MLSFLIVSGSIVQVVSNTFAAQPIVFPVLGPSSYSNDFTAPRSNGQHNAIDIIAGKHQKIVSATSGSITYVGYPQPSWGYSVFIRGDDGYTYRYIHMNNDTPGTDDGKGGPMNAYGPDMKPGNRVVKGQLLGWVGDSGNAENTVSHLHFEMFNPSGQAVNPYDSLLQAQRVASNYQYPALPSEILPYSYASMRLVNLAMGNVDADQADEIVSGGAAAKSAPQIRVYNSDKTYVSGFNVYPSDFTYGFDVGTADIDNDGVDEIITGAGRGYQSEVKVLRADGTLVNSFLPFGAVNRGISVAGGDVDGDGTDEIVVSKHPGSAPMVAVFKVTAGLIQQLSMFMPYGTTNKSGADITIGDVVGDTKEEIITGPLYQMGPDVRIFDLSGTQLGQFYAYERTYSRGLRVSAGNVRTGTAKAEILTVPAYEYPRARMFSGTGTLLQESKFMEEWWRSQYDVAAGNGSSVSTTGVNRRTTIRFPNFN
mgnify:FL=1